MQTNSWFLHIPCELFLFSVILPLSFICWHFYKFKNFTTQTKTTQWGYPKLYVHRYKRLPGSCHHDLQIAIRDQNCSMWRCCWRLSLHFTECTLLSLGRNFFPDRILRIFGFPFPRGNILNYHIRSSFYFLLLTRNLRAKSVVLSLQCVFWVWFEILA